MTPSFVPKGRFGFIVLVGVLALPWLAFLSAACSPEGLSRVADVLTPGYVRAIARSAGQAWILAAVGFLIGWLFGTLLGLWQGRGCLWISVLILPLAVPPYVWAIGVQGVRGLLPYAHQPLMDGYPGMLVAMVPLTVPLPLLAAWLKARGLEGSAIEAVGLAAGPHAVLMAGLRCTAPTAAVGSVMAGCLVFADAGCDQIMGSHGFSSQVMNALAARGDFVLAASKAILGSMLVVPVAALSCWWMVRQSFQPSTNRSTSGASPAFLPTSANFLKCTAIVLVVLLVVVPVGGLMLPLLRSASAMTALSGAASIWGERAFPSLQRPMAAISVALPLGCLLAFAVRSWNGERWLLGFAGLTIVMPPLIGALGWIRMVNLAEPLLGPIREHGWMVGISSGARLAPAVGVLLGMGLRRLPESSWDAAKLTGVSLWNWWVQVLMPTLSPWVLSAGGLVSVLTVADTHAELLLQPPGGGSFTAYLMAVLDNASASSLSALGLIHILTVWILLGLTLAGFRGASH